MKHFLTTTAMISLISAPVFATEIHIHKNIDNHSEHNHSEHKASSYAPIGIMGDHAHKKGGWMISLRSMHMDMEGNQNGSSNISPETIVTTQPNRFFGNAGQPPTLRVVPTKMTMDMQMIGAMYAPTDWLTLMGMLNHVSKDMDHITFQGGAGTTKLGEFNTKSSGWGDTKIAGLFSLYENKNHTILAKTGLSLPTGSIDEDDDILAPTGARPTLRLPYAMQLGSGTYDFEPAITYIGNHDRIGWGTQYSATIHLGENSEYYTWGDKHSVSAWGSYDWKTNISSSLRVTAETEDSIDGIDPSIMAPVQTADPDNYGGKRVSLGLGTNYTFDKGMLKGHHIAFEASVPIYQNLNGIQMARDWSITIGWKRAF